jgi:hypothetical protein
MRGPKKRGLADSGTVLNQPDACGLIATVEDRYLAAWRVQGS